MALSVIGLFALSALRLCLSQDLESNECYGKRIGHIRRHPTDCSKFVVCAGNGVQRVQECPAGLFYNIENDVCDHAYLVDCRSSKDVGHRETTIPRSEQQTTHYEEPEVHVHLHSAERRPMVHSVHFEIPQSHVTPLHTGPPQTPRHLTVPQLPHIPGRDHLELEPGVPNCLRDGDGLYVDPSDCAWYIQCAAGRAHRKPCPSGTYFSHQTGACGFYKDLCRGDYGPAAEHSAREGGDGGFVEIQLVGPELPHTDFYVVENQPRQIAPPARKPAPDPNHLLVGDELMSAVKQYVHNQGMQDAQEMVAETMKDEAKMASANINRRTTFSDVASFLGFTPFTKQLSLPASIQLQFLHNIRNRFALNKIEMEDIMEVIPSILQPSHVMLSPDMPQPHPSMNQCPYPVNSDENHCDSLSPYRTADGSCNNLLHPLWGKSFTALHRFLPPDYADGIDVPRRAKDGGDLPSARTVSLEVFKDQDRPSHVHTSLYVTFGQFLDHDMTRTAVTKLSVEPLGSGKMADVTCGHSECETRGAENRACFPISVSPHDPDFRGKECLMFVRTQESLKDDCSLGPREQINQLTSYLDASNIYGSDREQVNRLRDLSDPTRGRMNMTKHPHPGYKPLLPQIENKDCRDLNATIQCFDAGDGRVNEQMGLTAVHTMWTRYHNSIEEQLHILNPHWMGEQLFQVTRKIVGAVWQHTVFNEFLPLTLGTRVLQQYGLTLGSDGYLDGYDAHTRADATNSFATAAFRFGHTMIPGFLAFAGPNFEKTDTMPLSSGMRRPVEMYQVNRRASGSGVDAIMHGAMTHPAQTPDQFFSKQITTHLFSMNPPHAPGLDLPAINIQRGRDHGIPGYNAWRKWCGLRTARTFEDLTDIPVDVRNKFRTMYRHIDDLDLFPGAVTERTLPGATVGPMFACIIGRQFRNSRVGDRFWYERSDRITGFTPRQLATIREMTVSSVVCNSCDRVRTIQKYALLQPLSHVFKTLGSQNYAEAYNLASLYRGENNERRPCSELPVLDLSAWQERRP